MKLPDSFKPGQLVKASDWNKIAREVNRIWAMETDANFELVKGEPWRIRYVGPSAVPEFSGPVWQILVWRPLATFDDDTIEAPSAVYLTGPFTAFGSTAALRIAKLQDNGTRTAVDTTFATNCGFVEAPSYFNQYLARDYDGDTLLVSCGAGIEFIDAGNANGLFFQFASDGTLAYSPPWAVPETHIPTITTNGTVTGIASYDETIATSFGATNSPAGIVLFDTMGNIIEETIGSGIYIRQDGIAANSYSWILSDAQSYIYGVELELFVPDPQGYKMISASSATGMVDYPEWYGNAGTGSLTGSATYKGRLIKQPAASQVLLYVPLVEWNGTVCTSQIAPLYATSPVGPFRGALSSTGVSGVPALTTPEMLCASHVNSTIVFFDSGIPTTIYILQQSPFVLTTVSGFNDYVSDVKFFRLKNDGVTHQYIVVGGFTTFNGEAAPYMVFIDQNGTRLTDLEWP